MKQRKVPTQIEMLTLIVLLLELFVLVNNFVG